MQNTRTSFGLLSVATMIVGCSRFSASDTASSASGDGGITPGPTSSAGIVLRGKGQFALQPAKAVVLSSPAAAQPGDAIWVAVGVTLATEPATVTAPVEFIPRGSRRIQGPAGCNWLDLAYFSGRAERGGAETYTFQVNAKSEPTNPVGLTGVLAEYSGVDVVDPIENESEYPVDREVADGGPNDTFVYTSKSLTTLTPNAELLYFLGDNGGGSWADPDNGPERVADTNVLAVFAVRSPAVGKTEPQRFAIRGAKCGYTGGGLKVVALHPAK